MSKIIGIDLGTTYSLMSHVDESGRVRLIPNAEGQNLTPSVVLIKDGNIQVGQAALNQSVTEGEYVARGIKRNMGDDTFTFQGLTPTQISAEILKKLKRDAEAFLGDEVDEAVITVPAYFTDKPLTTTKEAGFLAGFSVEDLPKEPTAAALYYGTAQMKDGDCILVYDLGGGTMDATVLTFDNDTFNVLASDGSQSLGGQDWTQRLVDFVSDAYEAAFGVFPASDRRIEQMIFDECEKAKCMLKTVDTVSIPLSHEGKVEEMSISLTQFDEMTADLLLQTTTKVESALNKAGVGWKDISKILLVGGSTRLRMVERALTEISGISPTKYRSPDELVALGAALYTRQEVTKDGRRQIVLAQQSNRGIVLAPKGSRGIAVVTIEESAAHGLGTVVIDRSDEEVKLGTSVIIPASTKIPASESREDYETRPHQTEIDIPVVQTDEDGLDPYSCHINKTYRFLGIPDRNSPSQIRVTFNYDKDAIINVSAIDVESQQYLEKQVVDFELPDIVEIPSALQILLVIDTSSSMEGQPLEDAKKEVKKVCEELKDSGHRMGLVQFGAAVDVVHPITENLRKIKKAVNPLFAENGTPMAEGIFLAREQLESVQGNKVAILVSDGFPNDEMLAENAANQLKARGITLYTISIGTEGAEFLQKIGDAYTQIESASGLSEAISNLLRRM